MWSGPGAARVATTPPLARLLPGLATGLIAVFLVPAPALAIDEFPVPSGTNPGGITAGPDGALWFVAEGTSRIYRMTTAGALSPAAGFPVTITGSDRSRNTLDQVVAGPDGALWFTQPRDNQIGRMTTGGVVTNEFTLPAPFEEPEGITVGADGALWFTAVGSGKIGRITTAGVFAPSTGFPSTGTAGAGLSDITAGPDGRLWFTAEDGNRIGALHPGTGRITRFSAGLTAESEPSGITPGVGGGLWFTEPAVNQIGRITTSGAITEYPSAAAEPSAIAAGRDGAMWFTASAANSIGRITAGGVITNRFRVTAGSEPSDITAGPDGALWFTEFLGDKIGRIQTASAGAPRSPARPIVSPTKKRCKVPNVRRLSVKKAKKKLKRAKCKYRIRGRGWVVSTSPKAGKRTTKRVQVKAKFKRPQTERARGRRSEPVSRKA
jgi:virginiamycin B lyase